MSFLLALIPWWALPVLAAAGFVAAWVVLRSMGIPWRPSMGLLLIAGGILFATTVAHYSWQSGWKAREVKQERIEEKAVKQAGEIRRRVEALPPEAIREELRKWAR